MNAVASNLGTLALQDGGMCPMCEGMMGMGWIGILLMALFWILVLAGIGWLIWYLIQKAGARASTPEEVLRERYARGEIDRPTYEGMLDDLRK